MNIGIYGGTFDPIHNGHLAVCKAAIERFSLDFVYMLPTNVPPHKSNVLPLLHRYAMVALATCDEPRMVPITLPYTYAFEEVKHLKNQHPNDYLYYIMGMDSYLDLEKWKMPRIICGNCGFIVSHRPGFNREDIPDNTFYRSIEEEKQVRFFTQVHMPIRATDIRIALGRGDMVSDYLIHPRLKEYVRKTGLYR